MKKCPRCHTDLLDEARFCHHCGAPQPVELPPPTDAVDWSGELAVQFEEYFLRQLRERIGEFFGPEALPDYSERLYRSGFRDTVYRRLNALAYDLEQERVHADWSHTVAQRRLATITDDLIDFFLVHHTRDLNTAALPESILRYQTARWATVDLYQMVIDYLDFAQEPAVVYTDFVRMPSGKIRNATRSFLLAGRNERVLLISDQSLFGNFKEGFALTDVAMYWKATFQPARSVFFRDLDTVRMERDYLLINGLFFDASRTLNLKLHLLLRKLRDLNRD